MKFKLKELPQLVYWAESFHFTVIKEDGQEMQIRKLETSDSTGIEYWTYDGEEWKALEDEDLAIWLGEEFYDQEIELIEKQIQENK